MSETDRHLLRKVNMLVAAGLVAGGAAMESRVDIVAFFDYHDPAMRPGEPYSSYINMNDNTWWIPQIKLSLGTRDLWIVYRTQNTPGDVKKGKGQLRFYFDLTDKQTKNHRINKSAVQLSSGYSSQQIDHGLDELKGRHLDSIWVTIHDAVPIEDGWGMTDEDEGNIVDPIAVPGNVPQFSVGSSNTLQYFVEFLPPGLTFRK